MQDILPLAPGGTRAVGGKPAGLGHVVIDVAPVGTKIVPTKFASTLNSGGTAPGSVDSVPSSFVRRTNWLK